MKSCPPLKALISAMVLGALAAPALSTAQVKSETVGTEPAQPAKAYNDYFHIPIWGLRVGGAAVTGPVANDSWHYVTAGRAILKVSPSLLDYGVRVIGEALPADTIKLQNVGAEALTVGEVSAPRQYLASSECNGAVLPPLATCIFTVRYAPVDVSSATGFVDVPFSAKGGAAVAAISVKGTSVKPASGGPGHDLGLVATDGMYELRFPPPVYLGEAPKFRDFELSSTGEKPLSLKSISVTKGSLFYAPTHTCPSTLAVGDSCRITVQLNPLAVGVVTGELKIESASYDNSDVRVRLVADIDEWARKLSNPAELDFDVVDQGYASTQSITLKATGNLPVSGIAVKAPSPFTVSSNTCTGTLQPKNSCTVEFSLNRSVLGPISGTAQVTATDLSLPATNIELKANVQLRQVTVSPTSFDFGLKDMAKLAPPKDLTVTNTGTIAVVPNFGVLATPSAISAANGTSFKRWFNDWTFLDPGSCVYSLAPGASCVARVSVQPAAASAQSASTTVYPHEKMTVRGRALSVSVTGTKQSFVYNPTLMDLGLIDGIRTAEGIIEITNTSLDSTSLTGFATSLTQPSGGRGSITLSGGTCTSTLTAAQGRCVIKAQITGTSLARDEVQESLDGVIHFRFSGADTAYTNVPIKFLLRGNAAKVTTEDLNFGDVPVGVSAANAPRRLLRVENPGPSIMTISGVTLPGVKGYSLTASADHAWPNSCGFNRSIEPGTSCVVALYPTSMGNSTWGAVSTNVQLQTVVNGVTQALGPQFTMTANHLPVTLQVERDVKLEAGELRAQAFDIPFKVSHGGSANFSSASATAPGLTAALVSTCVNKYQDETDVCTFRVSAASLEGGQDRVVTVPIRINYENTTREVDAVKVTVSPELATYSLTPERWDLGDVTAQGRVEEVSALRKLHIIKNESARANIILKGMTADSALISQSSTGNQLINGVTTPACATGTSLAPKGQCYWTLDMVTKAGNVAAVGEYSGAAAMATFNEFGSITLPIQANFLAGELEVLAAPEHFQDIPSATRSAAKVLKLHNKGRGNLRFVAGAGMRNIYDVVSDSKTVDFQLMTVNGSYATSYGSDTKAHKPANTDETLNCTAYYGLQPGATCSLYVVATPSGASRDFSGKLVMEVASPSVERVEFPLTGNSLAASVYYSSEVFEFPQDMLVGTEYKSQIVVGNGGNYPLRLTELHLSSDTDSTKGTYPDTELAFAHSCPAELPPGEECVMELTLVPDRNMNWGAKAPKQRVFLKESSQGVTASKLFYLTGVSGQSLLTVENYDFQFDGVIERADFPSQYMYTMKFTATGLAPVRVTSAASSLGALLVKNATCTVGKVISPGDSCTLEVWSGENMSTTLTVNGDRTWTLNPLTINGTQVDEQGKTILDRSTQVKLSTEVVVPTTGFKVVPAVVPRNRSLPFHLQHDSFRPGLTLNNDSRIATFDTVEYPGVLRTTSGSALPVQNAVVSTYVANNSARDVTVQIKTKGAGPWRSQIQKAEDYNLFFSDENSQVFTTVIGEPVTTPASRVAASFGSRGGLALTFAKGELGLTSLSSMDYTGKITSTTKVTPNPGGPSIATLRDVRSVQLEDGRYLVSAATTSASTGCGIYVGCSTTYAAPYALYGVTLAGDVISSVSALDSGDGGTSSENHATTNQVFVADEHNFLYANRRVEGNINLRGKSGGIAVSASVKAAYSPTTLSGVAALDGYVYLWSNDTFYVLDASNLAQAPVVYRYPGVFAEKQASGIAYSAKAHSFIAPCYSGTAICTIPVYQGSLGVAAVEAGQPGVRGYNDGSANATLDIETIVGVSAGDPVVSFVSASGAKSTRAVRLNAIPTYGELGVLGNEFEATMTSDGSMVPHVVTLKNLTANPLNILGLSDASVGYTTTCVDVPYAGECTVTVEVPPTKLATGSGSFSVSTTSLVNFSVNWTSYKTDPYWANVVYMLDMEGANDAKALNDKAKGVAATFVGGAKLTTSVKRNGASALALTTTSSAITLPGYQPTGDFTIEGWVYPVGVVGTVFDMGGIAGVNWQPISLAWGWPAAGHLNFMASSNNDGTDISAQSGCVKGSNNTTCATAFGVPPNNQWSHFAFVRRGPQYFLYLNGVRTAVINKNLAPLASQNLLALGSYMHGSSPSNFTFQNGFNGYLDDFRITDNVARYTTDTFTVPAVGLPTK